MIHNARIAVALARSAALVALLSAPLAASAAEPATGGSAPSTAAKPASANPNGMAGVEQRIQQLHSELKITPDQESKWNAVAQAMRDNAASMEKLISEKQQTVPQNKTAVDDLEAAQQFAQANVDGLKNLTSAFKTLYGAMSDQQKKNADEVFARMNRAPPPGAPAKRNG